MKIFYNGWDREYLENKEEYYKLFDQTMVKEYEGSVENLETTIAEYTGRKYCIACNSATDALYFSLLCHGIGPGDEVLVTDFSWISTSSCISMAGATPVFCDIDLDSCHISFDSIKRMTTPNTKALIYTHLFGNMTDTSEIVDYCKNNNIAFIEDAAQSLGSSLNGVKAGTIGDCSSYSFNANKVIAGICGGGMFMTNNDEHAEIVKKLRRHGKGKDHEFLGYNSKMHVPNADIIQFRFQRMEEWQISRQEIAKIYDKEFEELIIQKTHPGLNHNYHKYVVRFDTKETRKRVKDNLKASIHYEIPLSKNSMYSNILHCKDNCYNSKIVSDTILSLPIHAWLTEEEIDHICNIVIGSI